MDKDITSIQQPSFYNVENKAEKELFDSISLIPQELTVVETRLSPIVGGESIAAREETFHTLVSKTPKPPFHFLLFLFDQDSASPQDSAIGKIERETPDSLESAQKECERAFFEEILRWKRLQ